MMIKTNLFTLFFALFGMVVCLRAQAPAFVSSDVDKACERIMPRVVEWRRYLHQYPELSNREYKTGAYVEAHLRKLGLEVRSKVARTGVVGILKGKLPGPVIALRADMDALPVKERVPLPFASKERGEFNNQEVDIMHACGHDSHVAMLMGAAEVLTGMRDRIKGTIVFIFQPAEEGPPSGEEGGAPLMIKEGVMDNPKVDAIFGIHIDSRLEIGQLRYKSGAFMASSDWFMIKVKGKQTHGAAPWGGIDPIVVGSQIINGLQTIVSRQEDLSKAPVVITIGRINGGVRENIIPEEISMAGTIRTLNSEMQRDVHERIRRTAQNIAEASGAVAEVSIDTKTLVTFNDPELVKKTIPILERAVGNNNVKETEWRTGAEDFSFYGLKAPAFFFNVGGRPGNIAEKDAFPHHTPDFYIDDSRLDVGVKAFCYLALEYVP
jgi:amidohydrolase